MSDELEARFGRSADTKRTADQRVANVLGEDFDRVGGAEQQRRLFQAYDKLKEQGVPFQGVLVDAERSELLDAFTAGQLAGKFQEHHLDLRSIVVADKVRAPKKPPTEGEWKPGDIIG